MTRAERAGLAAVFAVFSILGPGWRPCAVHAQSAEAEVLFRDGRDLLKQGRLVAGCDKLAASERLESSVGTLLNLGDCREKLGKLASAWAAFRKAEAMARRAAGDDRRQAEASRRAAQLEPRLPHLEIDVAVHVDGLSVRRDDDLVGEAQWNTSVPVDPGSYTIVAEAAGYQAWRTTVPIGRGAVREVVVVPRLEPLPPAPVPEPPEMPEVPVVSAGQPPVARVARPVAVAARGAGTWTPMRKLSVGVALAGAGALATGVYFGVHANALEDQANRRCPLVVCADPEGLAQNDQAQTSAWRANLLYIAGGGALAAGMVLWLIGAPDDAIVVPTAGDRQLGAALTGRF